MLPWNKARPNVVTSEPGNAVVEFVGIMAVIIVPALVLISALGTLAAAQFALNAAARDAVREAVRAPDETAIYQHAQETAEEVWSNREFTEPLITAVSCQGAPCLTPGADITITVSATVPIPLIDRHYTLSASQTMKVDAFRAGSP
ncbi:MAG: hypothetical protein GX483_06525 [Actinomycetaceae bacterium]|nr:hypothetical protein [Actinomycetaceae bacterium]